MIFAFNIFVVFLCVVLQCADINIKSLPTAGHESISEWQTSSEILYIMDDDGVQEIQNSFYNRYLFRDIYRNIKPDIIQTEYNQF